MIKAYMIADLNCPTSKYYYEKSIRSFESCREYIDIELIQCVTPETSDKTLPLDGLLSPTEFACINSHYNLMKRLAQGEERFIIMEHDAYLLPQHKELFIHLVETMPSSAIWNPGIAMECYSFSKEAAQMYCRFVEKNLGIEYGGTMEICLHASAMHRQRYPDKTGENFLWVVDGYSGKSCYADKIGDCIKGRGFVIPSPVSQIFSTKLLNTVEHIRPYKKVTSKDHVSPNMIRID